MKLDYITEVVFDGSTDPGTIILNGFVLKFDTDKDAKQVFDILNKQCDAVQEAKMRVKYWKEAFEKLPELP